MLRLPIGNYLPPPVQLAHLTASIVPKQKAQVAFCAIKVTTHRSNASPVTTALAKTIFAKVNLVSMPARRARLALTTLPSPQLIRHSVYRVLLVNTAQNPRLATKIASPVPKATSVLDRTLRPNLVAQAKLKTSSAKQAATIVPAATTALSR